MKLGFILLLLVFGFSSQKYPSIDSKMESHVVDLKDNQLSMYWKNEKGVGYRSFRNLQADLEAKGKKLKFAMNGGMYMEDRRPLGLYVENGVVKRKLNTARDLYGNFYLHPNGVFGWTKDQKAFVIKTESFRLTADVQYATQSGPMLLIEGKIHPKFNKGSSNLNIRNGVGVLPDGKLLFAMSKQRINFYDFATFFKEKGCKNALYLDGFVSRMYLPEKGYKGLGGNFGVIIAESD